MTFLTRRVPHGVVSVKVGRYARPKIGLIVLGLLMKS
jgi:hypothetical protein